MNLRNVLLAVVLLALTPAVFAQDSPYFVTYDHHLEEPGNLEISVSNNLGIPRAGQPVFSAPLLELEYGVKAWWTAEFYLEGQSRERDSTIFTGWRLENRFRPLAREHRINPVLYFEFENINEGSRIMKEVVGHADSFDEPNADLRRARARELETKLILSSTTHDWNISENFIVEKNLTESEGYEFGYSLGVWRPLARIASEKDCRFCRENFIAGLELYGGLGSTEQFGFHDTAHYLAPVMRWNISDNSAIIISPAVGLTSGSNPLLLRCKYLYEVNGFGSKVAALFRSKP
ncbi:MAG: hypothetical protein LAN64_01050 [Acidobacteriia bacterium]|nr:hypothetical protein [Terriglobia bacterium]